MFSPGNINWEKEKKSLTTVLPSNSAGRNAGVRLEGNSDLCTPMLQGQDLSTAAASGRAGPGQGGGVVFPGITEGEEEIFLYPPKFFQLV